MREFKIEAVKLSYKSDKTRKETAEELGYLTPAEFEEQYLMLHSLC